MDEDERQSLLTDVKYAQKQLELCLAAKTHLIALDCIRRAQDGLERVEARLEEPVEAIIVEEDPASQFVLKDYKSHAGKILLVRHIVGYVGDTDNQVELSFPAECPLRVRVETGQDKVPEQGLFHRVDEWMDPYWDVEVVDLDHPSLPKEGLRSAYIFGNSYNLETGQIGRSSFRVEEESPC